MSGGAGSSPPTSATFCITCSRGGLDVSLRGALAKRGLVVEETRSVYAALTALLKHDASGPVVLLLVEPERWVHAAADDCADLNGFTLAPGRPEELVSAAEEYAPKVVCWRYAAGEPHALRAIRDGDMERWARDNRPHAPPASPATSSHPRTAMPPPSGQPALRLTTHEVPAEPDERPAHASFGGSPATIRHSSGLIPKENTLSQLNAVPVPTRPPPPAAAAAGWNWIDAPAATHGPETPASVDADGVGVRRLGQVLTDEELAMLLAIDPERGHAW